MTSEIDPKFARHIASAYYMWLTTVRADGMPQPTPVWFIWENGQFTVYSSPTAQKVKNIRQNPKVALSFTSDPSAEEYLVVMGEATLEEAAMPAPEVPAYIAKYRQGISDIKMTPESFAQYFSLAIHIKPTQIRGE
jgi:PPOX class probable F420-dependent enzyme